MFTGIIEEKGKILQLQSKSQDFYQIKIKAKLILTDVKLGDSIAVNGVCLTVTDFTDDYFTADIMAQTLEHTTFKSLQISNCVNLERALPANGRFGGHIVSGHIDGIGEITNIEQDHLNTWITISPNSNLMNFIVEKGSITIDGISLTVAKITNNDFTVALIPHTLEHTNLGKAKVGELVNLETDILGKYISKLLNQNIKPTGITEQLLQQAGFKK